MKAIILAAGLGKRMDLDIPKCLTSVEGKSILEHQLKVLKKIDIEDIFVVIGTRGQCWTQENYEAIREIHPNLIYNYENYVQSGYSLYLGLQEIKEDKILFLDGDILFKKEVIEKFTGDIGTYDFRIMTKTIEDYGITGNEVIASHADDRVHAVKLQEPHETNNKWLIYSGMGIIYPHVKETFCTKLIKYAKENIGVALNSYAQNSFLFNKTIEEGWTNINTDYDLQTQDII